MSRYEPLSVDQVKTYSITTRDNKVNVREHFAASPRRLSMQWWMPAGRDGRWCWPWAGM